MAAGFGRAGNRALGRPVVKWLALALLPALLPALLGCQAVSDAAAVGAGAGAGAATGNPAVGFAVGVTAQAGLRELRKYVSRSRQHGEQDAIADAAGAAPVGATVPWQIRHTIPIDNERGVLAVSREYAMPLATCREVVFTVDDDGSHQIFTTALCRGEDRWRWAVAEPAVDRWGYLQ